ncbi:MAG: hypothetical protein HZB45_00645 [Mycolicibacterium rufum]|nr:hypothetical protein [Mycolicibacterium rufum]
MAHGIEFYRKSTDRRSDITEAKKIVLDVFNQLRSDYHDFLVGQLVAGDPKASFIFGGFSWRLERFLIWTLHYDRDLDRFSFRPASPWGGGNEEKVLAVVGDVTREAKGRIVKLLKDRGKLEGSGFDMEPFEVLRDLLRDNFDTSIGGAPQLAKVYRYMQTQYFAINWPNSDGPPHALGRPQLRYEQFDLPVLDPDKPQFHAQRSQIEPDADSIKPDEGRRATGAP